MSSIDLEFNNDHERRLFETARVGIEAQEFLDSPLGRYIRQRAIRDRQEALEKLSAENPAEISKITQHQADARNAIGILEWLSDAIIEGNQASYDIQLEEIDRA